MPALLGLALLMVGGMMVLIPQSVARDSSKALYPWTLLSARLAGAGLVLAGLWLLARPLVHG